MPSGPVIETNYLRKDGRLIEIWGHFSSFLTTVTTGLENRHHEGMRLLGERKKLTQMTREHGKKISQDVHSYTRYINI